jgi:hypothetical protein
MTVRGLNYAVTGVKLASMGSSLRVTTENGQEIPHRKLHLATIQ